MKNKAFIIVMDFGGPFSGFDKSSFHSHLVGASGVLDWWHYIDNAYIVIVSPTITAKSITDYVMTIAPNRHFLVTEVSTKNYNGWLPKDAWDWLERQKA